LKIVIVSAEESKWSKAESEEVRLLISNILSRHNRSEDGIVLVSGRCPRGGVDIWAEEVVDEMNSGGDVDEAETARIDKLIFPPEVEQWEDEIVRKGIALESDIRAKGYRSRNIQIAEACDVLYCFSPAPIESSNKLIHYLEKLIHLFTETKKWWYMDS